MKRRANKNGKEMASRRASDCFITVGFLISAAIVSSSLEITSQSQQPQPASVAANLLFYKSNLVRPDAEMIELLRNGLNHDHNDDKVTLHQTNLVWRLMRQNALEFARDRVQLLRPNIERLLSQTNVSVDCSRSLGGMLDRIAKLDSWAFQMYNSFGDFPSHGMLEGTLNSMGSFESCVDVAPNAIIGEPQYCSFAFQPILPQRPLYHNILSPIKDLANFTKPDELFHSVANKAQYLYYIKLRVAACLPTKCSRSDLESLGKQVGQNAFVQMQSVNCLTKSEGFRPDKAQMFSLVILASLAFVTFLGTLVHVLDLKETFIRRNSTTRAIAQQPHRHPQQGQQQQQQSAIAAATTTITSDDINEDDLDNNNKLQAASLLVKAKTQQHEQEENNNNGVKVQMSERDALDKYKNSSIRRHSVTENRTNLTILRTINVLINFSIIKNGKKLFDTTTSRKQGNVGVDMLGPGALNNQSQNCHRDVDCASSSSSSASNRREVMIIDGGDAGMGQASDISCVHGLRFWTISWIIFAHTMQYTEWADFARAYQVEFNITNMWLHPLMNATFSVDTFFLISGLLTTYVTWSISGGSYKRFNKFAFLISRYLRLTPQVLIVILLFIIFPLLGDGPYWNGMIRKSADNCRDNWWINALYLQAFLKPDRICNVVTWWLSIEMYFHFMSIFIIIALLKNARKGIATAIVIGVLMTAVSCFKHYNHAYPPNMLPTILQRFEVWDSLILEYFWSPFPHATAYIVGLMLGYVLSTKSRIKLSKGQVKLGWYCFAFAYVSILYGTFWWNNNYPYTRFLSTFYYNASQVMWAFATGWAILACASGNGGWLNDFLSAPIFVPLGRSTYMTYLSHMLIVYSYPAKMQLPIEPSQIVFLYIFISNLFLSYILGIALTLVYESPILHLQKLLVTKLARKCLQSDSDCAINNNNNFSTPKKSFDEKITNKHLNLNLNDNNNNDHDHLAQNSTKTSLTNKLMARSDPC